MIIIFTSTKYQYVTHPSKDICSTWWTVSNVCFSPCNFFISLLFLFIVKCCMYIHKKSENLNKVISF